MGICICFLFVLGFRLDGWKRWIHVWWDMNYDKGFSRVGIYQLRSEELYLLIELSLFCDSMKVETDERT